MKVYYIKFLRVRGNHELSVVMATDAIFMARFCMKSKTFCYVSASKVILW